MRKTAKASLYQLFQSIDISLDTASTQYVIDGGMLLYRFKWPSNCTFQRVFDKYILYFKTNFGTHISVIFRSNKFSSKVYQFFENTPVFMNQEKFLSNYENKSKFIAQLKVQLEKQSIYCYQNEGEADELIVDIATQQASDLQTVIVAEDVDILVILTARAKEEKEIYFLKLGKQNAPTVIYSSKSFKTSYPNSNKLIAFSHAFTGCDTVSAFYNKGKNIFFIL